MPLNNIDEAIEKAEYFMKKWKVDKVKVFHNLKMIAEVSWADSLVPKVKVKRRVRVEYVDNVKLDSWNDQQGENDG